MSFPRMLLHGGAALLLPLALAACSAPSSSGGTSPGAAGTSASTKAADPNASLLSGTKLKALLVPASALPKGFKKETSGTVNSGDSFAPPSSGPILASACGRLLGTSWVGSTGVGAAAFAQDDYADSYSDEYAGEIDAYRGDDAQTVMSRITSIFGKCVHFLNKSGAGTAHVTLVKSPLNGVGDEAVKAVLTSPMWQGGETIVAARVGNNVVTTLYSSSKSDKGDAAVSFAKRMVTSLQNAS